MEVELIDTVEKKLIKRAIGDFEVVAGGLIKLEVYGYENDVVITVPSGKTWTLSVIINIVEKDA